MSGMTFEAWANKQNGWNPKKSLLKVPAFRIPLMLFPALSNTEAISPEIDQTSANKTAETNGLTCLTCGLAFSDFKQQQQHFKTDLHIANLKRKMAGKSIYSTLEQANESDDIEKGGVDTLTFDSGDSDGDKSSSEGEISEDENSEEINGLLIKSDIGSIRKDISAQRGATFALRDQTVPGWEMICSAGLFPGGSIFSSRDWTFLNAEDTATESFSSIIKSFGSQLTRVQSNPTIAVFLLRSGRFAGAVFNGTTLLIHKVLRRYTVRAKAGGGQSSHDNKSGKARSAGATLRRHGEQALREDVAECLRLWSGHIQSCTLILISAPKTMRSHLFIDEANAGAGAVLSKDDQRIVFLPFSTRVPTLEEAKSVHDRCTSVLFKKIEENDEIVEGGKKKSEVEGNTPTSKQKSVEMAASTGHVSVPASRVSLRLPSCDTSERIFSALSKGEEETLAVLQNLCVSADGMFEVYHHDDSGGKTYSRVKLSAVLNMVDSLDQMRTPLHVASAGGMVQVVAGLLQRGASPIAVDVRGRAPYLLAKDKETRDAFRRIRGIEGMEDKWDWNAAGVGAALSEEMEKLQKQREKEKEKEKKKRAAQRKKDAKLKEENEAIAALETAEKQKADAAARSEAAMKNAGVCANCSTSLFGVLALDIYDRRCCSSACVVQLRRKLAADAALKRFQSTA